MAVLDLNTNEWINSDGLKVLFGNDGARPNRGGEYSQLDSGRHCVEVNIDLTAMTNTTDDFIIADNVSIPAGALIEQVDLLVTEVAAGATATLQVGAVRQDFTTLVAAGGFVNDIGVATLTLGASISQVAPVTGTEGTLIGTVLANTVYITAAANTAVFTDGVVRVRIYYVMPHSSDL